MATENSSRSNSYFRRAFIYLAKETGEGQESRYVMMFILAGCAVVLNFCAAITMGSSFGPLIGIATFVLNGLFLGFCIVGIFAYLEKVKDEPL